MNKTYFAPITSDVEYAGCIIMGGTTIPKENVETPPTSDPGGLTSPARKLYV